MKRATNVSIVICTRDRPESLRQTLQSFASLIIPDGLRCELVIVDNGSGAGTENAVQEAKLWKLPIQLVKEPHIGLGRARNTGLRVASGGIIVFTDDDVRVPPNWIEQMTWPIRRGSAHAVAGEVRIAPHLERRWMKEKHRAHLADTAHLSGGSARELTGANMAFSREVLSKVPAFDPELGAGTPYTGEETLFSMQILEAGYTIARAVGDPVEHHFDKARLLRASFLTECTRNGRFFAYADYHWQHKGISLLALRQLRSWLALWGWRALHPWECRRAEGASVREMEYVFAMSYFDTCRRLVGRPCYYERHGLVKLSGLLPDSGSVRANAA